MLRLTDTRDSYTCYRCRRSLTDHHHEAHYVNGRLESQVLGGCPATGCEGFVYGPPCRCPPGGDEGRHLMGCAYRR